MDLNYYPHHIGDYLRDTAHLTPLEDGIYRRMLDVYYSSERPLPKSVQEIYRLVRATTRQEKLAVDIVVGEFFTESESGWRNKRADEEILKSKEKSDLARESANMRWHKKRNANAMRTQCDGNAPNNQEPITKSSSASHGSRLPADWSPSTDLYAWASSSRPDLDIAATVEKFRDHWTSQPGAKGRKADWEATFRNWVRNEKSGPRAAQANQSGERI